MEEKVVSHVDLPDGTAMEAVRGVIKDPTYDVYREYWPDKLTVSEFVRQLRRDLPAFIANMLHLKETEKREPKEWMEWLTKWMELK